MNPARSFDGLLLLRFPSRQSQSTCFDPCHDRSPLWRYARPHGSKPFQQIRFNRVPVEFGYKKFHSVLHVRTAANYAKSKSTAVLKSINHWQSLPNAARICRMSFTLYSKRPGPIAVGRNRSRQQFQDVGHVIWPSLFKSSGQSGQTRSRRRPLLHSRSCRLQDRCSLHVLLSPPHNPAGIERHKSHHRWLLLRSSCIQGSVAAVVAARTARNRIVVRNGIRIVAARCGVGASGAAGEIARSIVGGRLRVVVALWHRCNQECRCRPTSKSIQGQRRIVVHTRTRGPSVHQRERPRSRACQTCS